MKIFAEGTKTYELYLVEKSTIPILCFFTSHVYLAPERMIPALNKFQKHINVAYICSMPTNFNVSTE